MYSKRRNLLVYGVVSLIFLILVNSPVSNEIIFKIVGAGHVDVQYDNNTYLNVTVVSAPAVINSYDIQVASTGSSRRNAMIDVGTEYKFVVNVTCPNTWQEIDYINITAWYDNENDSSLYNQTKGGNLNMFLQYKNTTGTAQYNMLWPDDEVTKGDLIETVYNESCHTIQLEFTPLYQVRSAIGDGDGWDNTTNATNDIKSWNFKIEVTTSGDNVTWVNDEYGVYRYCELSSSASVSASAQPGHRASTSSGAFTITYKANAPYKLNVTTNATLDRIGGGDSISRAHINVSGGDIGAGYDSLADGVAYILGSSGSYHAIETDDPQETVTDVTYHCDIPYGTLSGVYSSKLYYTLSLDTS
ncbi:MAG TPA: hypothetical protein ENF43_02680 [Thermoplasmatales archaeon]|nr:hypothetical protein [Thermoplasmatales archaeon]